MQGLDPSPEAEPAVLVRRLYLDLIGLPPTPSQVQAFLKKGDQNSYEQLIDSLLSTPHFGNIGRVSGWIWQDMQILLATPLTWIG